MFYIWIYYKSLNIQYNTTPLPNLLPQFQTLLAKLSSTTSSSALNRWFAIESKLELGKRQSNRGTFLPQSPMCKTLTFIYIFSWHSKNCMQTAIIFFSFQKVIWQKGLQNSFTTSLKNHSVGETNSTVGHPFLQLRYTINPSHTARESHFTLRFQHLEF